MNTTAHVVTMTPYQGLVSITIFLTDQIYTCILLEPSITPYLH